MNDKSIEPTPTDLSTKVIDNPAYPFTVDEAMDKCYQLAITHAIEIVTNQQSLEPAVYHILQNIINSLNKLKK